MRSCEFCIYLYQCIHLVLPVHERALKETVHFIQRLDGTDGTPSKNDSTWDNIDDHLFILLFVIYLCYLCYQQDYLDIIAIITVLWKQNAAVFSLESQCWSVLVVTATIRLDSEHPKMHLIQQDCKCPRRERHKSKTLTNKKLHFI